MELSDLINDENKNLILQPGDKLIIYSEGLFKQLDKYINIFGNKWMMQRKN